MFSAQKVFWKKNVEILNFEFLFFEFLFLIFIYLSFFTLKKKEVAGAKTGELGTRFPKFRISLRTSPQIKFKFSYFKLFKLLLVPLHSPCCC